MSSSNFNNCSGSNHNSNISDNDSNNINSDNNRKNDNNKIRITIIGKTIVFLQINVKEIITNSRVKGATKSYGKLFLCPPQKIG